MADITSMERTERQTSVLIHCWQHGATDLFLKEDYSVIRVKKMNSCFDKNL